MPRFAVFVVLLSSVAVAIGSAGAAPPADVEWEQTFSDEFGGPGLDGNIWVSGRPSIAEELGIQNQRVTLLSDGILHLVTRHHDMNPRVWTSASITPRHFRQTYGYAEVRLRFARATGLEDLVLLTTDGGFRGGGAEIVLVEGRYPGGIGIKLKQPGLPFTTLSFFNTATDFSADYHVFGLSWLPDGRGSTRLIWYLDGNPMLQADCPKCNQPMRLWIGTHVTTWAGPFAPVPAGASMDVDYVRVYQDKRLMGR